MNRPWTYQDFVKDAQRRIPQISCEELGARLPQSPAILDVREPDETASGTVPGAVLLPRGLLEKHAQEHLRHKDAPVYVICSSGNRSALSADVLVKMGFRQVFNVSGGVEQWKRLGLPWSGGPAGLAAKTEMSWEEIRRQFPIVLRKVPVVGSGERPLVYLDHAASTHAPSSVLSNYFRFMEYEYANVHRGTHLLSRKATERFDEAYQVVAKFIGAELQQGAICFTANTTQAIDLASHIMGDKPGHVVVTQMEHHSNDLPHRRRGSVLRARVNDAGELDMGHLEELLRKNRVKLVAVTAGSNITGHMPDLHAIAQMAHAHGALVLADAAQALARLPLDVLGFDHPEHIDFLAGAGHKAYAPFGAGFLYGPRALMDEATPYLVGGGTAKQVTYDGVEYLPSPDRHQGGTPNIGGVVAMASALQFLDSIGRERIRAHEVALTQRMVDGLLKMGGVTLYGVPDAAKRLGVLAFNVDGVSEMMTAAVLSEEGGLAVRSGRFCAHPYMDRLLSAAHSKKSQNPAPTGAVRASVGLYNDVSDVDRLIEFVQRVRDRAWVGRYQMRGDVVSAEFASRCADQWMESAS